MMGVRTICSRCGANFTSRRGLLVHRSKMHRRERWHLPQSHQTTKDTIP